MVLDGSEVPAAFDAVTRYRYVVSGDTLLSVNDVVPVVPICVKLPPDAPTARCTWYWVAPEEGFQDSETELAVTSVAVRPVGAAGGSTGGGPPSQFGNTVAHCAVCRMPLVPRNTSSPHWVRLFGLKFTDWSRFAAGLLLPDHDQANQPMPRACASDITVCQATFWPLWLWPNSPTISGSPIWSNAFM